MIGEARGGKVGLVGTGMVGSSFAYALMQRRVASELVMIDLDHRRAEGEAMDLNHGLPFVSPMRVRAGTYDDLADAEVVVITAGRNQRPGETRLDLLAKNAAVIEDIVPKIVAASPSAIQLIATNPVDVLTQIAAEKAGLPQGRVLGSGTVLDTARFRFLLGEHFRVNPRSVHAYIIGEHGDTQVPVWSLASIGGVGLETFVGAQGRSKDLADRDRIAEQTRTAAYEIIQRKQATYYAIGLALVGIVEAILRDQKTVLTVCSPLTNLEGLSGPMSSSLPSVVGRGGAEHVIDLPLTPAERDAFVHSVQTLRKSLDEVRGIGGFFA
ncbi:L-lactate dehydrogenase [Tautonia marina]|uniref:L-lactate dehydrogenase n=1 Tax=Tautonia marina TaxID=2653855 RepID=UPI0012608A2E|nr:L-lactate dehydrogenase [Tautonia marina]